MCSISIPDFLHGFRPPFSINNSNCCQTFRYLLDSLTFLLRYVPFNYQVYCAFSFCSMLHSLWCLVYYNVYTEELWIKYGSLFTKSSMGSNSFYNQEDSKDRKPHENLSKYDISQSKYFSQHLFILNKYREAPITKTVMKSVISNQQCSMWSRSFRAGKVSLENSGLSDKFSFLYSQKIGRRINNRTRWKLTVYHLPVWENTNLVLQQQQAPG